MKKKKVKKIEEFKEGGYYTIISSFPSSMAPHPLHFFIIKILDNGNIVVKKANGDEDVYVISELQKESRLNYTDYLFSSKKAFVKDLNLTISQRQKDAEALLKSVSDLNEFIAKLP